MLGRRHKGNISIGVIGGGFAGLVFAVSLARLGFNIDLYEEHGKVGYPPHCTGLVSRRVVELLDPFAANNIVGFYRGLKLKLGDKWVYIEPNEGVYRLDRVRLEYEMLEYLESIGGRVYLNAKVSRIEPNGVVYAGGREAKYDLVILADGYHGSLHKMLGIGYNGDMVYGVNLIYHEALVDDDIIVDFDPELTDNLFAWILKVPGGALLGTGVRDPLLLRASIKRLEEKYKAHSLYNVYGGPVLTGPSASRLYTGVVVVVGDAAGLNKPLTGGGLYPNALAAKLSAEMIKEGRDPVESIKSGVRIVASKLRRQYRIARLLLGDPDTVGLLIEASAKSGLAAALRGEIDYDEHEAIFRRALRRPLHTLRALYHLVKKPSIGVKLLVSILL